MKAVKRNRMTFPPFNFKTAFLHVHKPAKMIISLNFITVFSTSGISS